MCASHLVAVRPRLRRGTALLATTALLMALLATFAASSPVAALPREDLDAPSMPADCFGPAQTTGEPTACHFNKFRKKRPTVVLWGDSHAWMYIPAVRRAVRGEKVNFVSFVAGSCPPIKSRANPQTGYSGKCERSNVNALAYVTKQLRKGRQVKVLLGSNWTGFRSAFRDITLAKSLGRESGYDPYTEKMVALSHEGTPALFKKLGKLGADVDVIAQAGVLPAKVRDCAAGNDPYACEIPRWRALREEGRTDTWLRGQMKKLSGKPRYITATDAYCTDLVCGGNVEGIFTWYDNLHLSATRTKALVSYFRPSVRSAHDAPRS
ncbi:SGNH hydrolase domain-containing protein [Nocardioides sp.]|uniref:SGNH hydrolase domain-containing protein n=1 Tax=Nocardioides sp. TaxID=35761 RepID=UPI00321B32AC